jgi:hypothetical protein
MIRIEFHPEAEQELSEAQSWYRERSRLAARAFATDIAYSVRQIAAAPNRWPETRTGERRFVLSRFPFFNSLSHYDGSSIHYSRGPSEATSRLLAWPLVGLTIDQTSKLLTFT